LRAVQWPFFSRRQRGLLPFRTGLGGSRGGGIGPDAEARPHHVRARDRRLHGLRLLARPGRDGLGPLARLRRLGLGAFGLLARLALLARELLLALLGLGDRLVRLLGLLLGAPRGSLGDLGAHLRAVRLSFRKLRRLVPFLGPLGVVLAHSGGSSP